MVEKMMNTKRAQQEIIGLVIIVLIVTVAMLMYMSTQAEEMEENQGTNIHKDYAHNELAISFLDTLVDTTVCGVNIDKLIRDCGSDQEIICSDGSNSCEKLNETIIEIKNKTLDEWDFSYGLSVTFPENDDERNLAYVVRNCTNETTGRSAPGWIPVSLHPHGTAMLELGICDG